MNENRVDDLPLFNLLSVLEGTLVNEYHVTREIIDGENFITLPQNYEDQALTSPDAILICGNQPELIERAVAAKVGTIILCRADVRSEWADVSGDTVLISTPLSARRVSRIIYQALPVGRISTKGKIVAFHLDDYLDDVRETLLESRYRSYPILDENEKVVGTLSRYHLLRPKRKQLVLVDHNEAAQSVVGLDQVDILEIIDHHRLADIQTRQPIRMRNEPVGSTNTIITAMYQELGVIPSPKIAGIMAAAILSDTVMFKSPTCTKKDIAMAERLSKIAGVSLEEIGKYLFSASNANEKTAEELVKTDYKLFHISGQNIGVGQITCTDSSVFRQRKEEFLEVMKKLKQEQELDIIILMLTDVLLEGSFLIYLGNDDVIAQAFSAAPKDNQLFLPGVMSRKKQIIPMLTALWG
jgi:manganese-dependent inorganic pyrophosphatase